MVGTIVQKERCTRCGEKRYISKVCAHTVAAGAAFFRNYGNPWEVEQNPLDDEEEGQDKHPSPVRRGSGDRDRDRQH